MNVRHRAGLGSATADALARRGATVVLVSRDLPRGEAARPALAPHPGRTCAVIRACCRRHLSRAFRTNNSRPVKCMGRNGAWWKRN